MKSFHWLFLSLAFVASPLRAQSQMEMNQQAARDAVKADKQLNLVYKELLGTLDADGAKLLKDSQRDWIAYRDAEAKFAADEARGGSMAPLLFSSSLAALTEERIKHLKQRMDGGGADASAPEPPARPEPKPEREHDHDREPEPQPRAKLDVAGAIAAAGDGAKTQRQAAITFFEAYREHDRKAAQAVASEKVLNKLVWNRDAGDNSTIKLMDDTHIYYEGGSIELKLQKNKSGRWIVADVGMTAD